MTAASLAPGAHAAWSSESARARAGVFVDFTAAWCVTCQFNKRTTLERRAAAAAFRAARWRCCAPTGPRATPRSPRRCAPRPQRRAGLRVLRAGARSAAAAVRDSCRRGGSPRGGACPRDYRSGNPEQGVIHETVLHSPRASPRPRCSAAALATRSASRGARPSASTDTSGKTVSLADYKGKHVVLEWVNPGCPFVQKHYDSGNMPATQKAAEAKGVVLAHGQLHRQGRRRLQAADRPRGLDRRQGRGAHGAR